MPHWLQVMRFENPLHLFYLYLCVGEGGISPDLWEVSGGQERTFPIKCDRTVCEGFATHSQDCNTGYLESKAVPSGS